jgi:hypothetical protein
VIMIVAVVFAIVAMIQMKILLLIAAVIIIIFKRIERTSCYVTTYTCICL